MDECVIDVCVNGLMCGCTCVCVYECMCECMCAVMRSCFDSSCGVDPVGGQCKQQNTQGVRLRLVNANNKTPRGGIESGQYKQQNTHGVRLRVVNAKNKRPRG